MNKGTDLATSQSATDTRLRFECWIDQLATFEHAPESALRDLRGKIAMRTFDLVVAGQFNRGKTSVINALLGAELLPVGVVPLTSVVAVLSHADSIAAEVLFDDGRQQSIAIEELAAYATERGNPKNAKSVSEVRIACPAPWLCTGMRLIDTPGVGSIYQHNSDVAYRYLPKADAALLVLSVEQPLSAEECNFLKLIGDHAGKTFVLLNKTDLLGAGDLREAVDFTRRAVTEAAGAAIPLFAVSARLALQGAADPAVLAQSGFPEFLGALDAFLRRDSSAILEASTARQLLRIATQMRTGIELESRSLTTPLEELERKIELFEAKKGEVKIARDDSAVLLGKEAVQAWMNRMDQELAILRTTLQERLTKRVEDAIAENAALSTRRLSDLLQQALVAEIRAGYDAWRGEQDQRLAGEFTAWCARHARQIDDSVDELFRFSSELFAIEYDSVRVESAWSVKTGFYYKFWSEPPSMRQLATVLVLALPRVIGHRLLRTRYRAFARENIETQSGRVRYDLLQRLEASVSDFRRELMERIDTAISGIEAAIRKGAALHETGEQASAERLILLRANLEALSRIEDDLRSAVGMPVPPNNQTK